MFEGLNEIELSGEKFPIKCDLLVLEKAQEKYGDIEEFEKKIMSVKPLLDEDGKRVKDKKGNQKYVVVMPDIEATNDALYWMALEGEDIAAEHDGREKKKLTREAVLRRVDLSPVRLAMKVHEEFARCFEEKNAGTTQGTQTAGETIGEDQGEDR